MAHKSRLGCLVIDCQTGDLSDALAFWSAALGGEGSLDDDGKYGEVRASPSDPRVLIQAVDHAPRIHLDIETSDQEAEAARLEGLGAKRIGWVRNWIIMEAPSGHRFCLVTPQRPDFDENAKGWS